MNTLTMTLTNTAPAEPNGLALVALYGGIAFLGGAVVALVRYRLALHRRKTEKAARHAASAPAPAPSPAPGDRTATAAKNLVQAGVFVAALGILVPALVDLTGQVRDTEHMFFPLLTVAGLVVAFVGGIMRLSAHTAARAAQLEAVRQNTLWLAERAAEEHARAQGVPVQEQGTAQHPMARVRQAEQFKELP